MRKIFIFHLIIIALFFILTPYYVFSGEKWYEGGKLHYATGLEWQAASYNNKLATCGDIVAGFWMNGRMKDEIANNIHNIDDLKPFAEKLLAKLDDAFKKDPSRKVNEAAAESYTMMHWGESSTR
jgi:hypothetical protein